ncbi:hypothetical protein JB92DRAFT_2176985 [Gautieria morchelliformis]|nr:hypothetical protein JB92DRAFT_2176985 [Gautieria morchelliformis]
MLARASATKPRQHGTPTPASITKRNCRSMTQSQYMDDAGFLGELAVSDHTSAPHPHRTIPASHATWGRRHVRSILLDYDYGVVYDGAIYDRTDRDGWRQTNEHSTRGRDVTTIRDDKAAEQRRHGNKFPGKNHDPDPDGSGWVVLSGRPSLSTLPILTLVPLLVAELCGAPVAGGRNTNRHINTTIQGPQSSHSAHPQSPIPSQAPFPQIWRLPLSCVRDTWRPSTNQRYEGDVEAEKDSEGLILSIDDLMGELQRYGAGERAEGRALHIFGDTSG